MLATSKTFLLVGIILALLCVSCYSNLSELNPRRKIMRDLEWGDSVTGWRLSTSLDRTRFVPGETIIVTIVFKNVSDQEQDYGAKGKDFDHNLDCRNEQDEKVPLTLFGKRMVDNRGEGRYIMGELASQEQLVSEISLARHLDLSLEGKYKLRVSREIFPHEDQNEPPVVSNTVTFEITE